MEFKEWLLLKESIDQNLEGWLRDIIKYAKPQEKALLDNLSRSRNISVDPPSVGAPYRDYIVEVLKEKRLEDANWLAFSLGYLSAKKFRREDLEMAVDVTKRLISSGELPKREIGAKGWMITGRDIQGRVEEFIKTSQSLSNRAQRKLRKTGNTSTDDERLIKLVAEEGRKRLYLVAAMDPDLQNDKELWDAELNARHRILCKYGKETSWCTANADGSYHAHYKFNNIYIVHLEGKPVYQFVDCNDKDNHQFMDESDNEVTSLSVGMSNFLSSHANIDCYEMSQDGFEDLEEYLSSTPKVQENLSPYDVAGFLMQKIDDPMSVLKLLGDNAGLALRINPDYVEKIINKTPKKTELMDFYLDGLDKVYDKGQIASIILDNHPDRESALKRIIPVLNRNPGSSYNIMSNFIKSLEGKSQFSWPPAQPSEASDKEMNRLMDHGLEFDPEHAISLAKDKVAIAERLGPKLNSIIGKSETKRTQSNTLFVSKKGLDSILHDAGKDGKRLAEVFFKHYTDLDMDKARTLISALSPSFERRPAIERILKEKGDSLNDEVKTNLQKALEKGADWLWRV